MNSLFSGYNSEYLAYEHNFPLAFPWKAPENEDVPRYVLGADGYWFDPKAKNTGKAILSCAGDLMCEPGMTNACRFGDTYFFHPLFQYVRPILKASDFTVGNLETLLGNATAYAGEYHRINRKFHCNGPECYLDALRYAGFDALVTANNHNCDGGITGLFDTLSALDRHSFPHTGSFRSKDEPRVLLVNICGIKVAILSYATYYNRLDKANFTPLGIDTVLNYFSEEKIRRDTAYARKKGAEFILCYIHWGDDYDDVPNQEQYDFLNILKEQDVDYILGSHTHDLQRHDVAVSSTGKKIPMMFSMGNFITSEPRELCKHTAILQLMLTNNESGIHLQEKMIPCYVHTEFDGCRYPVVPADPMLNGGFFGEKMEQITAYVRNRVGDMPEFLPTAGITLGQVCSAMGVACPPEKENHPVMGLAAQVGALRKGGLYFSFGNEALYAKREVGRRNPVAVICREPMEGFSCILVSDVAEAYQKACACIRPLCNPVKTVLVAGNENKTLTRELVKAVLESKYKVYSVSDGIHLEMFPWQKVPPMTDFCLMELREDHPLISVLPQTIEPDILILTGETPSLPGLLSSMPTDGTVVCPDWEHDLLSAVEKGLPTDGRLIPYEKNAAAELPFAHQKRSAAAALALGNALDIKEVSLADAVSTYREKDCTKNILSLGGVRLILNLSCKTAEAAQDAFEALSREDGRCLAVLGSEAWIPMAENAGADAIFLPDKTERELEKEILDVLQPGDSILFLGSRDNNLYTTVRRLFGLTDGFMPNCEYWTGDEMLII